jgi:mono/diheme cytochrome c family protein
MKTFLLGAITGAVLLAIAVMLYLRLGFAEVRADLTASGLETHLMTAAVRASVQREAPEEPNPVTPTDENLIAGGKMFMNNCAGCHGGIDGADDNSGTLFPPIPQLHRVGTDYTEAQIFWIAKHGIRRTGMFANGKWYPDKDLWAMAAYVKRIRNLPSAVRDALRSKKM